MGDHARLSASSAERFMACPRSVALSALVPEQEESEYAAEGTAAHALAERCLREGVEAWTLVGEELPKGFTATPEMAAHVQVYLDYVLGPAGAGSGAELLIEHRIEDEELGESFGGTADAVVHRLKDGGGFVHVVDLKYGAGLAVEIDDNPQLRYYAFGVLRNLGVTRKDDVNVGLTIVQPRAEHPDGPERTVWVKSATIIAWGEDELLPAMRRVDDPEAPTVPGDHCRWCPAKLICPALTKAFEAAVDEVHYTLPLEGYSDEMLEQRYALIGPVETYIKALKAECFKRALAGNPVPGTKLIQGRSSRAWKEGAEAAIVEVFGEDAYTDPELKSVAQIEKLPTGKEIVAQWSYRDSGGPRLVAITEKGVPFDPSAETSLDAAVKTLDSPSRD